MQVLKAYVSITASVFNFFLYVHKFDSFIDSFIRQSIQERKKYILMMQL